MELCNPIVIGSTGLIGMNLSKVLSDMGIRSTGAIHKKMPCDTWPNIDYQKSDMSTLDSCVDMIQGHDVVFMCASQKYSAGLAAMHPAERALETLDMTSNVMRACLINKVKKIVLLSSSSVYTDTDGIMDEEYNVFQSPVPHNRYYYVWLKRMTEKMAEMVYNDVDNSDTSVIIFRPTNVYGPYDDFDLKTSYVMPALIRKVADGMLPLTLWGDGQTQRNFVYAGDLAQAMIKAAKQIEGYEIFNIGASNPITLKDLSMKVLSISGVSDNELKLDLDKPSSDIAVNISFEKIKEKLDYKESTSIEDGIKITREWYIKNKTLFNA